MDHDSPDFLMRDESITVVRGKEGDRLGDLRNLGIQEAKGEFVFQWDDDDWHHEKAMSYQLEQMLEHGWQACCLKNQIRYSFSNNCAFICTCSVGHAGTIMHRTDTAIRYPSTPKSEDAEFWKGFWKQKHGRLHNDPCLYIRFHHSANTWDMKHIMKGMADRSNEYDLEPDQVSLLREVKARYAMTNGA